MKANDCLKNVPKRRNEYLIESFIKTISEIIKFFSSIERVENYSTPEPDRKKGADRLHLVQTDTDVHKKWSYHSPKLSRPEFEWLVKNPEIYYRYMEQVLLMPELAIKAPEKLTDLEINKFYIKAINNLEQDWNFHRAYYKVFHDVSGDTFLFLDLQAFCATRHVRFIMRECFRYIEGNFVVTLREEDKVYIPHLQFARESVELPYASYLDLELGNLIADYILKEQIKSVADLQDRLEKIQYFKADVAKDEPEKIFLRTSRYIDHSEYYQALKKWVESIKDMDIDFSSRESIINKINYEALVLPDSLFREEERLYNEDKDNYQNDRETFFEHKAGIYPHTRWKRRIIRELFRDLIQYDINRHRIIADRQQRTEYENVFREYKNMTFHEKDIGCLLVEDGEISFVLLLDRYANKPDILNSTHKLEYWGLIERSENIFQLTPRAERMARWCMKLMGLKYTNGKMEINYENKAKIARSYAGLIEKGHIFSWMKVNGSLKSKIASVLGEMICSKDKKFDEKEILDIFKRIATCFYDSNPFDQSIIRSSLSSSRFQKDLNEWLRAFETINRAVIAFPVNTIPSEVESKSHVFSIFIGTFHLDADDPMYSDDEDTFETARRQMTNQLNNAKIFFTLVGIPASQALSEAIITNRAQKKIEFDLGRYAHKVKNEGVNLISRVDTLSELITKNEKYAFLKKQVLELKDAAERLSGSVHILNIASNRLQWSHMASNKYCILDVILNAYCNAFQQFFISGVMEEREKFLIKDSNKYELPILKLAIDFYENGYPRTLEKNLIYIPTLVGLEFQTDSKDIEAYNYIPDADDLLDEDSLRFVDILPQKVILKSPFLEMFSNALTHMKKEKGKNLLEVSIKRTQDEIEFKLQNPIPEELHYQPLTKEMQNSAGLRANSLFFKNIGGSFEFSLKDQAIAKARINFDKMMRILR